MTASARLVAGAAMALGFAVPACAEAVTYSGKIAGKAVGLEMTDASEGAVVGQFFWLSDGVDIPLQPAASAGAGIAFSEEGPCSPTLCARDADDYDVVMLFISHDLGIVSRIADTVAVMRDGKIVETGPVEDVFRRPQADYTRTLLASIPRVDFARLESQLGDEKTSDAVLALS